MPIGGGSYPRSVLPDEHWDALYQAQRELIDLVLDDLTDLAHGAAFADLEIATYLPKKYLLRYEARFLRNFLVCLVSVGLKLVLPGFHPLGCTAEEIALDVVRQRAAELLDDCGITADFGAWDEVALEDTDHEWLYEPAADGIEDSAVEAWLGVGHLRYDEWFLPFNRPRAMHPYADAETPPPWRREEGFTDAAVPDEAEGET